MKKNNIISVILMILPFIIFDVFIRLYVGNVVLDGKIGNVMPIIFDVLWITLFVSLCLALPKKAGKILYALLTAIFAVWTFANYIYHCIFKQFLWISDISMAGEGSDYLGVVFDYISPITLILLIALVIINIAYVLRNAPFGANKKLMIVPVVSIIGIIGTDTAFLEIAQNELKNGRWEIWQRPALIYNEYKDSKKALYISGIYQYTAKSIQKLLKNDGIDMNTELEFADKYFQKDTSDNEMTGILKDKNIIFVLMESIDDFLIDEKYTPEISRMMKEGINFSNHFSPNMGAGYTFNSEFAANTGFYCPESASSASIFTKNIYPQTIANRLKSQGYTTSAIHFNSRQFYNREVMYKRWGYDNYYCLMDYMPIEKCVVDSEAVKNDKVFDLIAPDGKFMTYFITYSAHLPYDTLDNKLKSAKQAYPELIESEVDEELMNLKLLAHDTDEFFRLLNQRLEEKGIAEDTVIVAYTDHYAYGLNNKELLFEESKKAGSEILEKTPFFIYCKDMNSESIEKVTSTVDILPMLENMLGLEKSKVIGNDAFNHNSGLVYFQDGRWFDGNILFDPQNTTEKNEYISEVNKYISDRKRVNNFVVEYDYFKN